MAASLDLGIVVEGIEAKEELRFIKQKSSKVKVQGYLFSNPVPFSNYKAMLIKNQNEPFDINI